MDEVMVIEAAQDRIMRVMVQATDRSVDRWEAAAREAVTRLAEEALAATARLAEAAEAGEPDGGAEAAAMLAEDVAWTWDVAEGLSRLTAADAVAEAWRSLRGRGGVWVPTTEVYGAIVSA